MKEFEKNELVKEKIGKDTVLVSPAGCRTEMMMNLRLWMVACSCWRRSACLGGCAQSSGDADPDPDDTTTTPTTPTDPVEPDGLSVAQGAGFRRGRRGDDSLRCSQDGSRRS